MPLTISHLQNGWATAELMENYLRWLSIKNEHRNVHLLWDCHINHRADNVTTYAGEHNVNLQYIPAGQTGTCQTLDAGLFGGLKSKSVAAFNKTVAKLGPCGERNMDIYVVIQILWQIWKGLKPSSVLKAWSRLI